MTIYVMESNKYDHMIWRVWISSNKSVNMNYAERKYLLWRVWFFLKESVVSQKGSCGWGMQNMIGACLVYGEWGECWLGVDWNLLKKIVNEVGRVSVGFGQLESRLRGAWMRTLECVCILWSVYGVWWKINKNIFF